MKKNATLITAGIPIITTVFAGAILASSIVSADDSVVDNINITVPVSCSISGTGMNTHNASIVNGTYQSDIGTTILHAFCNDSEGFAIYAAGYTGDEIGATNSNKLVGASTNIAIETGLATSTPNPDVSNWAMKLAITQDSGDTTGTNAYTIDSAPNTSGGSDATFSQYHVVPNEYTKVAHKNSATNMTANTGGVKLTTTYAAYISKTQPADTYTGQVIYTLVHPASTTNPKNTIRVTYNNDLEPFDNGAYKNQVTYGDCSYPMYYTATAPEVLETSNLTNGTQSGGYTNNEYILQTRTYDGATKIKVEVDYSITAYTAKLIVFNGAWDGDWSNWNNSWDGFGWINSGDNTTSTRTYMIDDDTITVFAESWDTPESGYDYGFYVRIYPIYDETHENTTPIQTDYYIGNSPTIIKTPNILNDGTQNGAYYTGEEIMIQEQVSFTGADKVKVVLKDGLTANTAGIIMVEGNWDGISNPVKYYELHSESDNISGTNTYFFDSNMVTLMMNGWNTPESGYDYGMYAEFYPIYETEQENTTPISLNMVYCFGPIIGTYVEPNNWRHAYWYSEEFIEIFYNETEVIEYLEQNKESLLGKTIDLYIGYGDH